MVVAGLAAALSGWLVPAGAQAEPRRVLIYGDSLTWEAQAGIEAEIERQLPGWDAVVDTAPGIAVCDRFGAMEAAGGANAGVVVIEFVGVPFAPCMQGRDPAAAPAADLGIAMDIWARRGVPVVLVGTPRGAGEPIGPDPVAQISRDAAAGRGQRFVDAGLLLRDPWTGVYQGRLPCLAGEGPAEGCEADGMIAVRSADGGHFCAIPNRGPCPVYSSGIVRFAAPIAAEVARAAGVEPQPHPGQAVAPGVRDAVAGVFANVVVGRPRAEDAPAATAAGLSGADVSADFAEGEPPLSGTRAPGPSCRGIRRALARPVTAHDDTAVADATGRAAVTNALRVYRSERRATAVLDAYTTPAARRCLLAVAEDALTVADPTAAIDIALTSGVAPLVGADAVRYDLTASLTTASGVARDRVVVVVARAGRSVGAFVFADAAADPPADTVLATTGAVMGRAEATLGPG